MKGGEGNKRKTKEARRIFFDKKSEDFFSLFIFFGEGAAKTTTGK